MGGIGLVPTLKEQYPEIGVRNREIDKASEPAVQWIIAVRFSPNQANQRQKNLGDLRLGLRQRHLGAADVLLTQCSN